MQPNKLDNSIKEKLEGRNINPSRDAWAKLSQRLESEDKKHNRNTVWWIGIAASVIGVMFVAFQFFSNQEVKPLIVDSPTIIQNIDNTQVAVEELNAPKEVVNEIQFNEKNEKLRLKENLIIKKSNNSVAVIKEEIDSKEKNQLIAPAYKIQEQLTLEEQTIQDVVAKVNDLKKQNQVVSNNIIDALLLEAQREIKLKQLYNNTTGIVDANMLLENVENELDQSFRSKVFEALKASYNTVKTAVAQRNN